MEFEEFIEKLKSEIVRIAKETKPDKDGTKWVNWTQVIDKLAKEYKDDNRK